MKGVKKANLPAKAFKSCGLPFTWRKKWEKEWENISYCSKLCRGKKN
ncbi:MAG: DUF2256 domain-containing protein [Flavobacterium sp.]